MKTQNEKELLETLRKWEDLCHEGLADTAYWKAQAMELHKALRVASVLLWKNSKALRSPNPVDIEEAFDLMAKALAKAEGRA